MVAAEKLFYLALNPITRHWLEGLNPSAESLHDAYGPDKARGITYREMCLRIVEPVLKGRKVCAAFYGHPGILTHSSHWAIEQVRTAGGTAAMLPGISAEACLFADLGVNPGDHGWQSHEASTFLLRRKTLDPTSELILWQVGVIGEAATRSAPAAERPLRIAALVEELTKYYPPSHEVIIYEAATVPGCAPRIRSIRLIDLSAQPLSRTATLFVRALPQRQDREDVAAWFAGG